MSMSMCKKLTLTGRRRGQDSVEPCARASQICSCGTARYESRSGRTAAESLCYLEV
ncbi:hypothetical protein EXIGLDRAFT_722656 [Exidia glandulosa HHB12029]|uniref:Uncharacterized protein n=1 Tax=Exidia glandulosa HHB12029 TaxID=1314781 RepID=A0A166A513_EXIGL|nr:hypothetical protein EXIGLDRAFT_722656 [Exidia glandulosa HHB12029]